jgi:purine nucleosidase
MAAHPDQGRPQIVMVVDTGTDDAGALIWAATDPRVDLVAVISDWGNVDVDLTTANTLAVLHAAGRDDVPVFRGAGKAAAGATPARFDASVVMGTDGLNGVVLPAPERGCETESGAEALVRIVNERPGQITLVPVSPFTPVAAALALDPDLPSKLFDVVVMGGAIASGGNLSAVAEANVGNDPAAAAVMVDAFGRPGALASGRTPRLVPLDATHVGTITEVEIALARSSTVTGSDALAEIWRASHEFSSLEPGDGLPVHDLLAALCVTNPEVCIWNTMPLQVDTAGGAAWGMTVGDRRLAMIEAAPMPDEARVQLIDLIGFADTRWQVAMDADVDRFRAVLHDWLGQ